MLSLMRSNLIRRVRQIALSIRRTLIITTFFQLLDQLRDYACVPFLLAEA